MRARRSPAPTLGSVEEDQRTRITGGTAAEIADSVRSLIDRGALGPGDLLPPVRTLAEQLGVNRNTAVAAYRILARSGAVIGQGRAGTRVQERRPVPQEGYAAPSALRDLGSGNPDPAWIPELSGALQAAAGRPVLYGEKVIDPELEAWARGWMAPDVPAAAEELRLTLTSGAVDAVERLLDQALQRGDAVALEDPCFLASIHTVRLNGYRAVPVPVDEHGMTPDGLRSALDEGVRAVVCTPRAQNPTGASLSAERAEQLRAILADHPYVLVIQDDYFSFLSQRPLRPIIGPGHRRWALVRSVSKFLGPDMCLAVTATDAETADRLALRLSPGTTWVSHLLQRITLAQVTDPSARALIDRAGRRYAERNAAAAEELRRRGLEAQARDGLSLWVRTTGEAREVAAALERHGWLARTGDAFHLADDAAPSQDRKSVV